MLLSAFASKRGKKATLHIHPWQLEIPSVSNMKEVLDWVTYYAHCRISGNTGIALMPREKPIKTNTSTNIHSWLKERHLQEVSCWRLFSVRTPFHWRLLYQLSLTDQQTFCLEANTNTWKIQFYTLEKRLCKRIWKACAQIIYFLIKCSSCYDMHIGEELYRWG